MAGFPRLAALALTSALAQPGEATSRTGTPLIAVDLSATVERVMGGVVNIRTLDRDTPPDRQTALDRQFENLLIPKANPNENPNQNSRSLGSGFFFFSRKHVVTNYHVVRDAKKISIVMPNTQAHLPAKILGFDEKSDIAVLSCDPAEEGPVLRFGPAEKVRLGEPVFAIGNPFGYGHTITSGILSARGRTIGAGPFNDFLQTDAAINPGNSGGPLFNSRGDVIGINTATAVAAQGISFAIPSEIAEPIVAALIKSGRASRAWLGVLGSSIVDQSGENRGSYGVIVSKVVRDSPAARAGVSSGDVILAFNGKLVHNLQELERNLRTAAEIPTKRAELTLFRHSRGSVKIPIAIEQRPDNIELEQY